MFNLLVKYEAWAAGRDSFPLSRVFEYTEQSVIERCSLAPPLLDPFTRNRPDLTKLIELPALLVQEVSQNPPQIARVATITKATIAGQNINLDFTNDSNIPAISTSDLQEFASALGIADFEFSRTHWAVKDHDLYRFLMKHTKPRRNQPKVFRLPEFESIDSTLVSAMMPFDPSFDAVYSVLRRTAKLTGFRCQRADNIWEDPTVVQDVVSLIDRSSVVICDCTGRNPNVFYEVGIAHTLGREVILITQAKVDIPFDLQHLRFINYFNNSEGLKKLRIQLQSRLSEFAPKRDSEA